MHYHSKLTHKLSLKKKKKKHIKSSGVGEEGEKLYFYTLLMRVLTKQPLWCIPC